MSDQFGFIRKKDTPPLRKTTTAAIGSLLISEEKVDKSRLDVIEAGLHNLEESQRELRKQIEILNSLSVNLKTECIESSESSENEEDKYNLTVTQRQELQDILTGGVDEANGYKLGDSPSGTGDSETRTDEGES